MPHQSCPPNIKALPTPLGESPPDEGDSWCAWRSDARAYVPGDLSKQQSRFTFSRHREERQPTLESLQNAVKGTGPIHRFGRIARQRDVFIHRVGPKSATRRSAQKIGGRFGFTRQHAGREPIGVRSGERPLDRSIKKEKNHVRNE